MDKSDSNTPESIVDAYFSQTDNKEIQELAAGRIRTMVAELNEFIEPNRFKVEAMAELERRMAKAIIDGGISPLTMLQIGGLSMLSIEYLPTIWLSMAAYRIEELEKQVAALKNTIGCYPDGQGGSE